ncbi:hypothetical protein SNEBB_004006, partial [Seison nebaliae]
RENRKERELEKDFEENNMMDLSKFLVKKEKKSSVDHGTKELEEKPILLDLGVNKRTTRPSIPDKENELMKPTKRMRREIPKKLEKITPKKDDKMNMRKEEIEKKNSTKKNEKRQSMKKETPKKNEIDVDEFLENEEKKEKRKSNYMKFMNREPAKELGTRNWPDMNLLEKNKEKLGNSGINGKAFVFTGILDTIIREDVLRMIEIFGGIHRSGVSGKTSFLVKGRDHGESKINKAKSIGVKILDEEKLFNLIEKICGKFSFLKKPIEIEHSHDDIIMDDNDDRVMKKRENYKRIDLTKENSQKIVRELIENEKCSTEKKMLKNNFLIDNSQMIDLSKVEKAKTVEESLKELSKNKKRSNKKIKSERKLWSEIYSPKNVKEMVGQQGPQSPANKLLIWLRQWNENNLGERQKKKVFKSNDGREMKAALLSGSPGVGKTTAAHNIGRILNFDIIELNASDSRSKKLLDKSLGASLESKSIFCEMNENKDKKVIIMDEVDGMSGNNDRGGIQELIQFIKRSKVPIICMCNDRQHQKIRSLVNYCFDLRFHKCRTEQLCQFLQKICEKEQVKCKYETLENIVRNTNNDIRQSIHTLQMYTIDQKTVASFPSLQMDDCAMKDIKFGPFDCMSKIFQYQSQTIFQLNNYFFMDYRLMPLFVQENYLSVVSSNYNSKKKLEQVMEASNAISLSVNIETTIRETMQWSLLPLQGCLSLTLPAKYVRGNLNEQCRFPSWLGRYSHENKMYRLLDSMRNHMKLINYLDRQSIISIYMKLFSFQFQYYFQKENGMEKLIELMNNYHLNRDDFDTILSLASLKKITFFDNLPPAKKASFTRLYNKIGTANSLPTETNFKVKMPKLKIPGNYDDDDDDFVESDTEQSDSINNDKMIKAKKVKMVSKVTSKEKTVSKVKTTSKTKSSTTRKETTKKRKKN